MAGRNQQFFPSPIFRKKRLLFSISMKKVRFVPEQKTRFICRCFNATKVRKRWYSSAPIAFKFLGDVESCFRLFCQKKLSCAISAIYAFKFFGAVFDGFREKSHCSHPSSLIAFKFFRRFVERKRKKRFCIVEIPLPSSAFARNAKMYGYPDAFCLSSRHWRIKEKGTSCSPSWSVFLSRTNDFFVTDVLK